MEARWIMSDNSILKVDKIVSVILVSKEVQIVIETGNIITISYYTEKAALASFNSIRKCIKQEID